MDFKDQLMNSLKTDIDEKPQPVKGFLWLLPNVKLRDNKITDIFIEVEEFFDDMNIAAINVLFCLNEYSFNLNKLSKDFESCFNYIKDSLIYCKTTKKSELVILPSGEKINLQNSIVLNNFRHPSIGFKIDELVYLFNYEHVFLTSFALSDKGNTVLVDINKIRES